MNMKRLLTLVAFFATLQASAQQVNPVPDYVFANRMSAGRNTVTDTAAYFSIGPRYGATRGMMPPMVVDTASFSANKRNGLLIFSVQKNKFLYWDSVGVKWAEMAGTGGSAITGSGVAGYMPEFTTTTNLDTTRLFHSAGRFAIGSTTTSNGVFNVYGGQSYFDTSLKVGTQTFLADEGKNEVYINTSGDSGAYALQVGGSIFNTSDAILSFTNGKISVGRNLSSWGSGFKVAQIGAGSSIYDNNTANGTFIGSNYFNNGTNNIYLNNGTALSYALLNGQHIWYNAASGTAGNNVTFIDVMRTTTNGDFLIGTIANYYGSTNRRSVEINGTNESLIALKRGDAEGAYLFSNANDFRIAQTQNLPMLLYTNNTERLRIFANGRIFIGSSPSDAGYQLDVNGTTRATSISTSAPSGGSIKPWKIGEAATVSPTSPNRTLRVEVDGVVYYIHAKTTND